MVISKMHYSSILYIFSLQRFNIQFFTDHVLQNSQKELLLF